MYQRRLLIRHDLVATGTTGTLLEEQLGVGIPVACNRATADFLITSPRGNARWAGVTRGDIGI